MKEPIPAKGKPVSAERVPMPKAARTTEIAEVRVLARFYRRMKTQRVFPLVVELQGAGSGASGLTAPVFIHPVIPGAHVTPAELTLDPGTSHDKATFYVTPLARGPLCAARLDVFYQGRLIQEVPLRMRSVTQCLTWVLAALTVLVPAFLLLATVAYPLEGIAYRASVVAPEPQPGEPPPSKEKLEKPPVEEKGPGPEKGGDVDQKPTKGKPRKQGKLEPVEGGQPRGAGGLPDVAPRAVVQVRLGPGEVLERAIINHVPDVPATVTVPWRDEPYALPFTITRSIAAGLSTLYAYAMAMKEDYLSFWVGVVFLALTIVSGVTHRSTRGRRRSQPLVLGAGGMQPPHG